MRRRRLAATVRTRTSLCAILALSAFASSFAILDPSADAAGGKKADGQYHPDPDPNNVTGLSEAMAIVVKGNQKYVEKDIQGAIDQYRRAIQLAPKNPIGHYMLGVGLMALGNSQEAEASFAKAIEVGEGSPSVKARALFAMADLKERQKKWEEAKTAWQAYADYVTKHADAGTLLSATTKLEALDDMLKQDKAYEVVRERIANDKSDAGKK